jgi:hypothetical protein
MRPVAIISCTVALQRVRTIGLNIIRGRVAVSVPKIDADQFEHKTTILIKCYFFIFHPSRGQRRLINFFNFSGTPNTPTHTLKIQKINQLLGGKRATKGELLAKN